jgi:Ca-activated chloride channel family protein
MDVLWPGFLALLLIVPLLIGGYIWVLRRRRRFAVRYSSLSLVREAVGRQSLRRHLPFALFVLAVASLVGALARPVAVLRVPTNQTSIMLALDVSRSMCATDIPPSRLEAAKAAALEFIERQPQGTQIGIVAFAGFAVIVQEPTADQDLLTAAIAGLTPSRGTAIGDGIATALEAIAGLDGPAVSGTTTATPAPVPPGTYVPEIIVVLTDGVSTDGSDPLEAARQAADRGVRVYTIGFGTAGGGQTASSCGGFGGGGFGGGGFGGGGRFRRGIDEETLVAIAEMTGGEYYSASSAGELNQVFEDLPTHFVTRRETLEISVAFTALGALLAAIAASLSLRWNPLG